jgi:hypothetical protein
MSSALDRFVDELRAVGPAGFPTVERLETAFHALQVSDNPIVIDECDRMIAIAGQRRPLRERLQAILDLMERRLQ